VEPATEYLSDNKIKQTKMKRQHKTEIRKFLYERLFDEGLRWDLADMCEQAGIDEFEAIETYEQEADRIRKMFCLDAE
jgi:hypothetical protein